MATFSKALAAAALSAVLVGCGGGGEETSSFTEEQKPQQEADSTGSTASTASSKLRTAQSELSSTAPTKEQVAAVEKAIDELEDAIDDLSSSEKQQYQEQIIRAQAAVIAANKNLPEEAEEDGGNAQQAANTQETEEQRMKAEAAKPIYNAIGLTNTTNNLWNISKMATYDNSLDEIDVGFTDADSNTITYMDLEFDENISNLSGSKSKVWKGKKYVKTDNGYTYEAYVYSDIGKSTPGKKFGTHPANSDYEYTLENPANDNTFTGYLSTTTNLSAPIEADKIHILGFNQSSGTKLFDATTDGPDLADKTPTAPKVKVALVSGTYHGVSGRYLCKPTSGQQCSAEVTGNGSGFTLGGGTWAFKPGNPESKVADTPDENYASYGWWIKKDDAGKAIEIDSFIANRGTAPTTSNINTLGGYATYTGSAVGQFAIYNSLGKDNDSGSFTAKVSLRADFGSIDKIGGTISNFSGPSNSSSWSIELEKADIDSAGDGNFAGGKTVWTIDGTSSGMKGDWDGQLQDTTDSTKVPKVVVGGFHAKHDGAKAIIVGAFGANKD